MKNLAGGSKFMKMKTKILSRSDSTNLNESIEEYEKDGWIAIPESLSVVICNSDELLNTVRERYSIAVVKWE